MSSVVLMLPLKIIFEIVLFRLSLIYPHLKMLFPVGFSYSYTGLQCSLLFANFLIATLNSNPTLKSNATV